MPITRNVSFNTPWWLSWRPFWIALILMIAVVWGLWDRTLEWLRLNHLQPPFYVEKNCHFDYRAGREAQCGHLYVRENRQDENSRTIRLPVVILPSEFDRKASTPVVYVDGGPGAHTVGTWSDGIVLWSNVSNDLSWLSDRDLIVFDARGVGGSLPSLRCPQQDIEGGFIGGEAKLLADYRDCRASLEAMGLDPAHYTTTAMAADLVDLRASLGIDSWDVWAVSHGTRVALTALQSEAHGIRHAVLTSVYPPNVGGLYDDTKAIAESLERVFAGCEASEDCRTRFPNLRRKFHALVAQLRNKPPELRVYYRRFARDYRVWLDELTFLKVLDYHLWTSETVAKIPRVIEEFSDGRYGAAIQAIGNLDSDLFGAYQDLGQYLSVDCAEVPAPSVSEVKRAKSDYPILSPWIDDYAGWSVCDLWLPDQESPNVAGPVMSVVPTLLLSGNFDRLTPPAWAEVAAATLPNAFHISFPARSHDVGFDDCASKIIERFLVNPRSRPSEPCLNHARRIDFELR